MTVTREEIAQALWICFCSSQTDFFSDENRWWANANRLAEQMPNGSHAELVSRYRACADAILSRLPMKAAGEPVAHLGDPCVYCGTAHDEVPAGPCQGASIRISAAQADRLLNFLNKSNKSGWPTPLWCEVHSFIGHLKALLSSPPVAVRKGVVTSPEACRARPEITRRFQ